MRMIAVPVSALQRAHQIEDLRLDRDVERGRRLVGDQQLRVAGERHRDHHALPHAARELVRIVVEALLRRGNAHLRSISIGALARLAPLDRAMPHGYLRRSARRS